MKKNLKQLKLRENLIPVVLVAVATVAAAGFLLVKPLLIKVLNAKDELESKKLERTKMIQQAGNIMEFKQQQNDYNAYWSLIEQALISPDEEIEFIRSLEDNAKKSGVDVTIKTYTPPKKKKKTAKNVANSANEEQTSSNQKKDVKRTYLMLTLQGDYYDFSEYLYRLENMRFVFKIEALSIKSVEKKMPLTGSQGESFSETSAAPGQVQANVLISYQL